MKFLSRYTKLNALREANLLLQDEIRQLRAEKENLLNRLMSRDFSEYQATQQTEPDDIEGEEDDAYVDLEQVTPQEINNARQK